MTRPFLLRCVAAPFVQIAIHNVAITLGRSCRCDLVVDHSSVSRRHAECFTDGDGVIVADLGSRNGTFVEDRRVERIRLTNDQTVRFGKVSFVIVGRSPDEEERTDLDPSSGKAVGGVNEGRTQLSAAERRVFELLLSGKKEKNIAVALHRSPHTIHAHIRSIFRIFAVRSRLELLAQFVNQNPQGGVSKSVFQSF